MKHSLRRRNASEKRSAFARKKSASWQRSANGSGGRRRSLNVRCAKKWSGFNARRRIGLLFGAVAGCGVYAVREHLCAVPQREVARGQVRHFLELDYAFSPPEGWLPEEEYLPSGAEASDGTCPLSCSV